MCGSSSTGNLLHSLQTFPLESSETGSMLDKYCRPRYKTPNTVAMATQITTIGRVFIVSRATVGNFSWSTRAFSSSPRFNCIGIANSQCAVVTGLFILLSRHVKAMRTFVLYLGVFFINHITINFFQARQKFWWIVEHERLVCFKTLRTNWLIKSRPPYSFVFCCAFWYELMFYYTHCTCTHRHTANICAWADSLKPCRRFLPADCHEALNNLSWKWGWMQKSSVMCWSVDVIVPLKRTKNQQPVGQLTVLFRCFHTGKA